MDVEREATRFRPSRRSAMRLTGIHHLTAVSADAPGNFRFYTDVMGLRLVKKTVNQDDTSAYHLFYADGLASPGSDLTFFDWPAPREKRGGRSVVRTALRVAGADALDWWAGRLTAKGVAHGGVIERGGRAALDFEDAEGQRLSLVDDGGAGEAHPWAESTVPAGHQIRGLGPITLSVPELAPTEAVLTKLLELRKDRVFTDALYQGEVHVFAMGEGGPAAELHVAVEPKLAPAQAGAGGVHHVALRTPTFGDYDAWAERLKEMRYPNSGPVDRYYFRSLYLREPNGVLIEIATDGPGFAVDEPMETLGRQLALPPFLEPRRAAIERGLKPLVTA
jgi:glyoxalase family protein